MNRICIVLALLLLCLHCVVVSAADIYIGSGVKVGEITDRTAIVLVRLTTTAGQNAEGLIPGREGQARLHYAADEALKSPATTPWENAKPAADWSIQFALRDLKPATRYFYRVECRTDANANRDARADPGRLRAELRPVQGGRSAGD